MENKKQCQSSIQCLLDAPHAPHAPPSPTEAGGQGPRGLPPVRVSHKGLRPRRWWEWLEDAWFFTNPGSPCTEIDQNPNVLDVCHRIQIPNPSKPRRGKVGQLPFPQSDSVLTKRLGELPNRVTGPCFLWTIRASSYFTSKLPNLKSKSWEFMGTWEAFYFLRWRLLCSQTCGPSCFGSGHRSNAWTSFSFEWQSNSSR